MKLRSENCPIKKKTTFKQRVEVSQKIKHQYPDRIPVIVFSKEIEIEKYKFLIPGEATFERFLFEVRSRLNINSGEGIYAFVETHLYPGHYLMDTIYKKHKEEDGFLYVEITKENAFGYF